MENFCRSVEILALKSDSLPFSRSVVENFSYKLHFKDLFIFGTGENCCFKIGKDLFSLSLKENSGNFSFEISEDLLEVENFRPFIWPPFGNFLRTPLVDMYHTDFLKT